MIVIVCNANEMCKSYLPDKVMGRYWIDESTRKNRHPIISVEAFDNNWIAYSNANVSFLDSNSQKIDHVVIFDGCIYRLQCGSQNLLLYANNIDENAKKFTKYALMAGSEISIGRNELNMIRYDNPYVSGHHAIIREEGGVWVAIDNNSSNGLYVNGTRCTKKQLVPGDVMQLFDLRVIYGGDFIAINNPENMVHVAEQLPRYVIHNMVQQVSKEKEGYFFRSPRLRRSAEPLKLKVAAPGKNENPETMPAAMVVGPSVTMGIGSMATGAFSVVNALNNGNITSAIPTMIMCVAMLAGMLLWPTLTRKYENKRKVKLEKKRQNLYRAYLVDIQDEINKNILIQTEILRENSLNSVECGPVVFERKHRLWEKTPEHDDFLDICVGTGEVPMADEITFPEKTFSLEEDNLMDDVLALVKSPRMLKNIPISVSLMTYPLLGIIGEDATRVAEFVKTVINILCTEHSYDEVKLMAIVPEQQAEEWDYLKWFPHLWNEDRTLKYFAADEDDTKELFALIDKELEKASSDNNKFVPEVNYVVLDLCPARTRKSETMQRLYENGKAAGFHLIKVADGIRNLPKECSEIIEVNGSDSRLYDKSDVSDTLVKFSANTYVGDEVRIAKEMSNIKLDLASQTGSLPNMITFLDMFKVGKIEYLNSLTRWKQNNPVATLKAPVGVDTQGDTFWLDLHEKFQGPHGLVAGMTGSGKSEFIITYILSMAINYHPDEVAFILIDYKGGGLTGAFENKEKGIRLPHLAGTITNLDGAAVKRSLVSIQSELKRRQAMFNDAKTIANEGTIDIYKYQKLYRQGIVKEPIPHLFIISDEFAELKSQQPEFMEQLISAARIGRSLGVHLILATQKPSGVVDDQIWSNTRFRVCLKVQSGSDSMDMIKRNDAAELAATGRFYLQVGFNELFALGQSAWTGAPYVEKTADVTTVKTVKILDNLGRVEREVRPATENNSEKSGISQLVGIVNYLSGLAAEEDAVARPLWLEEIPAYIDLCELQTKYNYARPEGYSVEAVIGEYDAPAMQAQKLLTLSFSQNGNVQIYGNASSGKELFLSTMIYDLCHRYSPDEVEIYALDFGDETLRNFSNMPNVGDVITVDEEAKVSRLLRILNDKLETRKKILADYNGSYDLYYKKNGRALTSTVVVINNFAAFAEVYEENLDELANLTRDGNKYGIYFAIVAGNVNEIKYRVAQNCAQTFMLTMNEKTDYVVMLGNTDGIYPSKIYGRGVFKSNDAYEYQVAHFCKDEEQIDFVATEAERLTEKYNGQKAKPVPEVPEHVYADSFDDEYSLDKLPVAINMVTVETAYLDVLHNPLLTVLGQERERVNDVRNSIDTILKHVNGVKVDYIDKKNGAKAVDELYNILKQRLQARKDANGAVEFEPYVYLVSEIEGLSSVFNSDTWDTFFAEIYRSDVDLNIHFIIMTGMNDFSKLLRFDSKNLIKDKYVRLSGLWCGEEYFEGYPFKARIPGQISREIKNECGFLIEENQYKYVRIVTSVKEEEEK